MSASLRGPQMVRVNAPFRKRRLLPSCTRLTSSPPPPPLNPGAGFLCPLSANTYGFEFLNFTISDYDSKKTIFEVGRDNPSPQDVSVDFSSIGEDMYRKIKYTFSEDVLRLPKIQTS